ncbi:MULTISPECIES: hypothetical protein [unclassified Sphingobacterium]|nr:MULTISPECIES: hypothetical protein [unclassified Sphingobacterium]
MKIYSLVAVFLMFIQVSLAQSQEDVAKVLDQWHAAAGKADF